MSKRDEDSQTDIEVGMTTAERRRRRRRGGGLRVPSDNVPRRNSVPPVSTPVPEDPALAMSIAYSFSNDGSEPVPRATARELHETGDLGPIAPIPADTVPDGAAAIHTAAEKAAAAAAAANVDPTPDGIAEILHGEAVESERHAESQPAARAPRASATIVETSDDGDDDGRQAGQADGDDGVPVTRPFVPISTGVPELNDNDDFETKTREMSAVDLESLGLTETAGGNLVAIHATPPTPPAAALAHRAIATSTPPPLPARVSSREMATPPPLPAAALGGDSRDSPAMPRVVARDMTPAPATSGTFAAREPDAAPTASESSVSVDPAIYGSEPAVARRPSDVDIDVGDITDSGKTAIIPAAIEETAIDDPAAAIERSAVAAEAAPAAGDPVMARVDTPPPPPLQAQAAAVMLPADADAGRGGKPRLPTVALNEDDLEEVRAQTQKPMSDAAAVASAEPTVVVALDAMLDPNDASPVEAQPEAAAPTAPVEDAPAVSADAPRSPPVSRRTEPLSIPDIDIEGFAEPTGEALVVDRAEHSGEIVVDVEDADEVQAPAAPRTAPPTPPPAPLTGQDAPRRPSSSSTPPPIAAQGAVPAALPTSGAHTPPPLTAPAHASPPPPPPATAKAPPAPPPAAKKPDKAPRVTGELPKMSRGKPWFVDLFDEDYLRTLPFLTPQATQAEAAFVLDAMGLPSGAQVLDVGCGYGRHAMELAARGMHVVGLDLSTPLLVRGGEEAHRRGLTINFIRGDMRELDFDGQFDGAYCLFSTFGYFDDETNKKTAANIARALKPGGKVLIEILNRDYVIADLPTRVWWEGDGCVVLEEVELNYFSSRIQVNRSVVFDDGRQLEQEISVRAYSLHEVGKLMHSAGFRVLEVSGGYQTRGRFFGNQSRHIIVLAERTSGR